MKVAAEFAAATARAARMIAGMVGGGDSADHLTPFQEARADDHLDLLVLALAVRCADLTRELYGERAEREADAFAFAALTFEQRAREGE